MTRPLRLEFEGALYHITSRGDRREAICESNADRSGFLSLLGDICDSYNRAIAKAYQSGGYTLREIATYFNLHYSTVSVIARNSKSKT